MIVLEFFSTYIVITKDKIQIIVKIDLLVISIFLYLSQLILL